MHFVTRHRYWSNDDTVANVERQLIYVEEEGAKVKDFATLVAILHNENFAAVRQSTGTKNLIFIQRNHKIKRMPTHLRMTETDRQRIIEKYLDGRSR